MGSTIVGLYEEVKRSGYHNLITETQNGIQRSLTLFKDIGNREWLEKLTSGYEYLNEANTYIGKVVSIEKYIAKEFTGSPVRVKVICENGVRHNISLESLDHLGIERPDLNY